MVHVTRQFGPRQTLAIVCFLKVFMFTMASDVSSYYNTANDIPPVNRHMLSYVLHLSDIPYPIEAETIQGPPTSYLNKIAHDSKSYQYGQKELDGGDLEELSGLIELFKKLKQLDKEHSFVQQLSGRQTEKRNSVYGSLMDAANYIGQDENDTNAKNGFHSWGG